MLLGALQAWHLAKQCQRRATLTSNSSQKAGPGKEAALRLVSPRLYQSRPLWIQELIAPLASKSHCKASRAVRCAAL